MIKWLIIIAIVLLVVVVGFKIIKTMLKIEKQSKKSSKKPDNVVEEVKEEPYMPEKAEIDINSSSSTIMTDMSVNPDTPTNYEVPKTFVDSIDDDFEDYSRFARSRAGRRRPPKDFDLDGDFADEYIPSSPEFSYLPRNNQPKNKPIKTELDELSTELKVLMLSDIFDRKFFD